MCHKYATVDLFAKLYGIKLYISNFVNRVVYSKYT